MEEAIHLAAQISLILHQILLISNILLHNSLTRGTLDVDGSDYLWTVKAIIIIWVSYSCTDTV